MSGTPREDLVGVYEIAEMAGVSRQAVANWRARLANFPEPLAELKAGPVFDRAKVRAWLNARKGQATPIESIVFTTPNYASTETRGAHMSQSNMSRHTKRILMAGGGLAVIVSAVLIGSKLSPSTGASIMGTVVPAERYRESQVSNADVKLGDTGVAQVMQTDMFERMVKDPEYRKQVVSAANAANAANSANAANAANSANSANAANAANSANAANAANSANSANSANAASAANSANAANAANAANSANAANAASSANSANAANAANSANSANSANAANAANSANAANAANSANAANAANAANSANAANAANATNH